MDDKVRLIDAEALKNYMCSACPNKERCEDTEQVCSAILDVDEQPTIEAQPVKHGRWINNTYTQVFPWKCEKCNYDSPARFNYCPNCGSRMAGDSDA